jgi:hypothetical protein
MDADIVAARDGDIVANPNVGQEGEVVSRWAE